MSKETALSYRNHMGVMFNLEILFKPPIKFSYKLSIKIKWERWVVIVSLKI